MAFVDEINNLLGLNNSDPASFCYVSFDRGILIEGYKKILELSSTKICLLLENNNKLEIFGNNLTIKDISHKEISINGKIKTLNSL